MLTQGIGFSRRRTPLGHTEKAQHRATGAAKSSERKRMSTQDAATIEPDAFEADARFEKPLRWECACKDSWPCHCAHPGIDPLEDYPVLNSGTSVECPSCGCRRPRGYGEHRHDWSDLSCERCGTLRPHTPIETDTGAVLTRFEKPLLWAVFCAAIGLFPTLIILKRLFSALAPGETLGMLFAMLGLLLGILCAVDLMSRRRERRLGRSWYVRSRDHAGPGLDLQHRRGSVYIIGLYWLVAIIGSFGILDGFVSLIQARQREMERQEKRYHDNPHSRPPDPYSLPGKYR
jgi:hypothetical protein